MTIERAPNARIDIAYERLGGAHAPPVLLIMGVGGQLIAWPDGFCDELVRHGLHLIRFDNRDVGQSNAPDRRAAAEHGRGTRGRSIPFPIGTY